MKNILAALLVLLLLIPSSLSAQDGELEQRYADENFSFDYPVGWTAISSEKHVMVMPSRSQIDSSSEDSPDVTLLTFVELNKSLEEFSSWPVDADLAFLTGYATSEVVSGLTEEENERVEYGGLEHLSIGENDAILMTFDGEEMSGLVMMIEHDDSRMMIAAFGTSRHFKQREQTIRAIIGSVKFKD